MTFLELRQMLAEDVGFYDQTIAADDTQLKNYINRAYSEIMGEWNWPFSKIVERIQTVLEYTTGTVSVSAGGTALTFSGTIAVSVQDRFIQMEGSEDWYQITAHTAASASATISPAYAGTSNLTNGTFTIRKIYYPLSTVSGILSVQRLVSPQTVFPLGEGDFNLVLCLGQGTGTPEVYMATVASNDAPPLTQVSFYPTPDAVINLFVQGTHRNATALSANSDEPLFNAKYHPVLLDRAAYYIYRKFDDSRANDVYTKSLKGIEDMKSFYRYDLGRTRVTRSIDAGESVGVAFMWPSNFGPMS